MRSITTPLLVLGASALASTAAFAAEHVAPHAGPWPGGHMHWPGFWWIFPLMMLFMFVFFAAGCFGSRRDRGYRRPPWRWMGEPPEGYPGPAPESALDILNKRYARGEIDKAEYEEKKASIVSAAN